VSKYGIIDAGIILIIQINFASGVMIMARIGVNQMKMTFKTEFNYKLDETDDLIQLANLIDWDLAEQLYATTISQSNKNTNSKDGRIAFGALILQQMFNFTDDFLIRMVKTNPYFQCFLGLDQFQYSCPFVGSTLVQFRKRITPEMIQRLNNSVCQIDDDQPSDDDNNFKGTYNQKNQDSNIESKQDTQNKGKLILDATCAPQDIKYPTDWDLLNKAREKTEAIIDFQHQPMIGEASKPRTYRIKARKSFLNLSKSKKKTRSKIRKVIRFQLECINRNIRYIKEMNETEGYNRLTSKQNWDLIVIHELYRQQRFMFDNKTRSVEDRIVSLHSPHIRPIVRGKTKAPVEFGAKLAISVVNGYCHIEKLSWDAYNEGQTLLESVSRFKEKFGFYPKEVLADKIYRTRDNLKALNVLGIKMLGPKLGRPRKDEIRDKRAERLAEGERNEVEGKFGQGKRAHSLGLIMTKRKDTSETVICLIILVLNLKKRLSLSFIHFFKWIKNCINPSKFLQVA
jgi:hypothetical protein